MEKVVGSFDTAPSEFCYPITVTDYFIKWSEIMFTSQTTSAAMIKILAVVSVEKG